MNGTPACLLDLRQQIVTLNQTMQGALRLETAELSFSQWILSLPQPLQKKFHKAIHQLLTEGNKQVTVTSFKLKDWKQYDSTLMHLTNGQIALTLKPSEVSQEWTTSISDGRRRGNIQPTRNDQEQNKSASHEMVSGDKPYKMTHLVDNFPNGLAMISHNWDITYANSKMEEICGYKLKDYQRVKLWDLYSVDEYYRFFQHYLRAMETKKPVEFEGYLPETETMVKMTVHPTEFGLTVFAQDITQYKKQLKALKDSEERFSVLANNINEVFWIASPDYEHIYYLSPSFQKLFGLSRKDFLKNPEVFFKILGEDDSRKFETGLAVMRKQKNQVEYKVKTPDGVEKWIRTKGFPIVNQGKSYVIGIHEDITECKEMIRLKEKSQQLSTITQMSAGIAHEIKNPLTAIKGFLQIGAANPDLRDNYQDIILDEVNRIEAIVQDFMMLSKPKSSLQLEEAKPDELVHYVLQLLEPEADEKNVQLLFDSDRQNETFFTEPKRVNQILINLVKNAIDAVDEDGRVRVKIQLTSQYLTVSVSDNGPGLSAQELSKVGEPFFTTKEKGTGLGVMVTKKMVADLNGTISYKSKVGEGTNVTVQLPRR
ncbi:PAS domain-containing sensor histidine kinase [Halobacillus fulvus]|nr:PAS domain-containing sensor histidine kinase [Halobacillus fulvus]